MSNGVTHRVVFRRRRAPENHHSGGNWKIAYADFITAMMAFFLVLWLVSITPLEKREGLAEYFRTPIRDSLIGDQSGNRSNPIPGGGADVTRVDGDVRRPTSAGMRYTAEQADRVALQYLRRQLDDMLEENPVLREFRPQMRIDFTTEGLRIQIVDDKDRPMFALGSAQVEPHMRTILREIAPVLNQIPNRISLAGHTDATPYVKGERGYSNWELSADRANASRRELVAGGLQEDKIMRVMGLASTMSLVKDDPYHPTNRRISLVVLNRETQHRIEQENLSAADVHARGRDELQELSPQSLSQTPSESAVASSPKGENGEPGSLPRRQAEKPVGVVQRAASAGQPPDATGTTVF